MGGEFWGVPAEVAVVVWTTAVGVAGWLAQTLWRRLSRQAERSFDLVDLLRRALDKRGIREAAAVSTADLLLFALEIALESAESPPASIEAAKLRAEQNLQAAIDHCREISGGRP